MREASEFGLRLRVLRSRAGVSAPALSKLIGFGRNTIRDYECGICDPTLSRLIKIADYFGVSLDYLVGREGFERKKGQSNE